MCVRGADSNRVAEKHLHLYRGVDISRLLTWRVTISDRPVNQHQILQSLCIHLCMPTAQNTIAVTQEMASNHLHGRELEVVVCFPDDIIDDKTTDPTT